MIMKGCGVQAVKHGHDHDHHDRFEITIMGLEYVFTFLHRDAELLIVNQAQTEERTALILSLHQGFGYGKDLTNFCYYSE